MSEQQTDAAAGNTPQQRVTLQVNDREMTTRYANAFRSNTTADELFLDFGTNIVVPNPNPGEDRPDATMTLTVDSRVIMNYRTAKRLAVLMAQVVRQHEEQHGEVDLNPAG